MKFNKWEKLLPCGIQFLKEIKDLFSDFGIKSSSIKVNNDRFINRNNQITRSIYINLSSKKQNLCNFRDQVGFESEESKVIKLNLIINSKINPNLDQENIYKDI